MKCDKRLKIAILGMVMLVSLCLAAGSGEAGQLVNDSWFPSISSATAYYNFEVLNDSGYVDLTGNDNNLINNGTEVYTNGIDGNSVYFNREENDYLNAPYDVSLVANEAVTYSVWINFTESDNSAATDLLGSLNGEDGSTYNYISLDNAGTEQFFYAYRIGGVTETHAKIDSFGENQWYHIAWRYNGSNVGMFVNGEHISNFTASGILHNNTEYGLTVGRRRVGDSNNDFNGTMDEIIVFKNLALTDDEISEIYQCGVQALNGSTIGDGCNYSAAPPVYPADNTAPTVELNAPNNQSNFSVTSVLLKANVTDNRNLTNISFWSNATGVWARDFLNTTGLVNGTNHTYTLTVGTGYYQWNVQACDNQTNCAWGTKGNFTFNVTISEDSNTTNLTLTSASCTTSSVFALDATAKCNSTSSGFNCSGTWYIDSMTSSCSLYNGSDTGTFDYTNATMWNQTFYYSCSVSATHDFYFNMTNLADAMQFANVSTTCSAAGGAGLSAEESRWLRDIYHCNVNGTMANGTDCSPISEDDQMELSLVLGLSAVSFFFLFFAFKLEHEHFFLKLLLMFFAIITTIAIPGAVYAQEAGKLVFLKITTWFYRIFITYFSIFLFWHWAKKSEKMMSIFGKVSSAFKQR
jgi:hypothetical protein